MSTTENAAEQGNPLDTLDSQPEGGDTRTRLSLLRDFGQHVDYSQQPTLAELPAVVSALVYRDVIGPVIASGQADHKTHAEIVHDVSHAIAPPDPDSNAAVVQGIDPASHAKLQAEVDELKAFVQQMREQNAALQPAAEPVDPLAELRAQVEQLKADAAGPAQVPMQPAAEIARPDALSQVADPRDAELLELRQQLERLQVQAATQQHPTGDSEPIPHPDTGLDPGTAG